MPHSLEPSPSTSLAGRRVIVTGGASGLGAAVVERLHRLGAEPFVLDRQRPPAGDGVAHTTVDLTDTAAAEQAVTEISERHGPIDAVVAAAGTDACGKLVDTKRQDWERVVAVNLFGNVAVIRAALPDLIERHGQIVTVASTLGLRALSDASAYCASKFATVGFSRALATELQGSVGLTLLIPGGMATPFFDGRADQYKPPPDAMLNDPDHVAETVMFALSQPPGCEVRELVVCPSVEPSWP